MRGCDQALASRQAALASGEHDDELLDDCISHTRRPDEASFQKRYRQAWLAMVEMLKVNIKSPFGYVRGRWRVGYRIKKKMELSVILGHQIEISVFTGN